MRLFFLLIGICPLFGATIDSQVETKRGRIRFEKMTQDFGDVYRGEKLSFRFKFKNSGNGPVQITGVHSSCGCTVVAFDRNRIYKVGESGSIDARLDTTNFKGSLRKLLTVITNSRKNSTMNLTMKAKVLEEIGAEPPLVDLGQIKSGDTIYRDVKVKAYKPGVSVVGAKFDERLFEVTYQKVSDYWHVRVLKKPGGSSGYLKSTVYLQTTSHYLPELPLLVRAEIKGSISYEPSYIEFGAVAPLEVAERRISIKRSDGYQLKDASAEIKINGRNIDNVDQFIRFDPVFDVSEDGDFAIQLTNVSNESGSVHGRLIFPTTDPAQEKVEVNFYAYFRKD